MPDDFIRRSDAMNKINDIAADVRKLIFWHPSDNFLHGKSLSNQGIDRICHSNADILAQEWFRIEDTGENSHRLKTSIFH